MNIEKMKVSEVSDKTLVNYLKNKGYDIKQSDKDLPKTWKEIGIVKGYYVTRNSYIMPVSNLGGPASSQNNKNIFRTEEQARASIALAQLSQLMFVYNEGWQPNWKDPYENKRCIAFRENHINILITIKTQCFLAFKTPKIRDKFLENFEDLIWQAKPLL